MYPNLLTAFSKQTKKYETKKGDRISTRSFEVVEKQEEIWFYRGKT